MHCAQWSQANRADDITGYRAQLSLIECHAERTDRPLLVSQLRLRHRRRFYILVFHMYFTKRRAQWALLSKDLYSLLFWWVFFHSIINEDSIKCRRVLVNIAIEGLIRLLPNSTYNFADGISIYWSVNTEPYFHTPKFIICCLCHVSEQYVTEFLMHFDICLSRQYSSSYS